MARTGMLLADNVLFHELVPLAEAMGAAAATAAAGGGTETGNSEGGAGGGEQPSPTASSSQSSSLPPGVVGAGILAPTPRRLKIAESLDGFNKRVREDPRVEVLMLPLRDGLSVVTWRGGGYPVADE